jgi:hypothetical protein
VQRGRVGPGHRVERLVVIQVDQVADSSSVLTSLTLKH